MTDRNPYREMTVLELCEEIENCVKNAKNILCDYFCCCKGCPFDSYGSCILDKLMDRIYDAVSITETDE